MGNYTGLRPFSHDNMRFERIRMTDLGTQGAVWRVCTNNPQDHRNSKRVFIPDMIGENRSSRNDVLKALLTD